MGGGNNPGIGAYGRASPHGCVFAFLKHPQQPSLGLKGHVADFIEEKSAAIGLFEAAGIALRSPGKGAFFMAEKLAFDQLAGDGCHVDGDKGSVAALTVIMQGPGHQLLAGPGLAVDENRKIGGHEAG